MESVTYLEISACDAGQRVDNFLRKKYPKLPKSRIYQMLRKGEVRRNKKRIKAEEKLVFGDILRIPPLFAAQREEKIIPQYWLKTLPKALLYEDEYYLIFNKPNGLAVHAGSGHEYGLIDIVEALWGKNYAELAHRIDSETSGLLVLAKTREALHYFQNQLKEHSLEKYYLCLVNGYWAKPATWELPLVKIKAQDGERMRVQVGGKIARSHFYALEFFPEATLLNVKIETGRTHQIRVTIQHCGHAIVGDDKYGNRELNKRFRSLNYRDMFLHAHRLVFKLPNEKQLAIIAPLPEEAEKLLQKLKEY